MKSFFRPFTFFRADHARIALALVLLVLNVAVGLLKPWPIAFLVDVVLGSHPTPEWLGNRIGRLDKMRLVPLAAGVALALHLIQAGLNALQNYVSIGIGLRGLRRVREAVFAALQRISLRFQRSARTGDLIHRAAWDTFWFQSWFQQGLMTAVSAVLTLGLMVAILWRLNVPLTLMALALVPPLLAVIHFFGRRMTERGAAAQAADTRLTGMVQQNIATLPLVQSYTREDQEQADFRSQARAALRRRLKQHKWELLYWLAVGGIFAIGTAATMWLGAEQVTARALTVGELLMFLAYLAQFFEPLNQLSHVGSTLATARAATDRVFELLDQPEEVKEAPDARPVRREGRAVTASKKPLASASVTPLTVRGALEFSDVSFAYEPGQPVLHGVSFTLPAGESLAVIGPSGAGKSTLMNLVPRFHDPTEGMVKLDGADLRTLRLRDLRAQIALVLQEPILLPATVSDNIAYGRPGAKPTEIQAAARAAHAHEFILQLTDGYATVVGDGGVPLSVGQRQRLNLARAFLKDAPVLLLDEPTSALDAESEAAVVAALFSLMKGRTTLVVAHRLSTIRQVDRVLVLESGRVTECGRPAELMARGGYFARVTAGGVGRR